MALPPLTLYVVRHAKSSWADPGMDDHERPLNRRGLSDAPIMAARFAVRNEPVDLLLSSTARRALATAEAFATLLKAPPIRTDKAIYAAHYRAVQGIVAKLPEEARRVMLFGHNPGFTDLCTYLLDRSIGDLPTCATVRLDLHVDQWRHAGQGTATLGWLDVPER